MKYDAIIVGGSFAGLSAAMQLARGRREVCIIDAGRPRNRFADHSHGFFGQDGVPPLEMIAQAKAKVLAYPTVHFIQGEVVTAQKNESHFTVTVASGEKIEGSKLVLASGVSDTLPELPGLQERWGKTVIHCPYCHGYEYAGASLGVLNAMPMSSHQALLVPDWGPTTFFLNGKEMSDADTLRKLDLRNVKIEPAAIVGLEGDAPKLTGVRLVDGRVIRIAALFVAPRTQISPLADQLGCVIEEGPMGPSIKVDEQKMTSVPGVFAAGDTARAMHNATFASADGVMVGSAVHRSLIFDPLA